MSTMPRASLCLVFVAFFLLAAITATAQKNKPITKNKTAVKKPDPKVKQDSKIRQDPNGKPAPPVKPAPVLNIDPASLEAKVRDMVVFLEYVLNTLGSNSTSARDKDVLITESYTKIFRDAKVQVEDDLDENRAVITNKDVPAYLKDVDFFFEDVKFEFTVESIKKEEADEKIFYKVSLTRNLKGTTADGRVLNNTIPRFIEINFNPKDQDLKIVSIYTKEFNEKSALTNWWYQLSLEWQNIFRRKLHSNASGTNASDSIPLSDIKTITSDEELDMSHDAYIQTLEPLSQLVGLKVLNLSKTTITDLNPLRNLTELIEINLSGSRIKDLSP